MFLDNILGLPDRWLQELRNLILLQSSYDVCLELRSLVYLNKIVDIDRVCSMIFCFSATIYEYSYIKYNGSYSDLAEESLYQLSADLSFGEQEEILVLSENKRIPAVCIRNKLAINKPIILIKNLLNVYLKINKLIVYHDKLLKKVTGSTNSWAFFESFADLSANPIKIEDSLYCNLPFYFEQISISDILIENRDAFLEIAKIPSYYLSTEYLNCDNLEFKDGYFSRAGVFISKFQPQMVGVPEKKVPASFLYLNKFFDFNQNYEKEFTMAFEIPKNILK
ncbi:hypothetical protein EON73_02560 [bacterium]|nr:MAG: hypothetical protein EON73_02560 [bacterium]